MASQTVSARRSGKTTRLIQSLPATGSIVVVPDWGAVPVLRDAVRDLRGEAVLSATKIIPAYLEGKSVGVRPDLPVFRDL